MVAGSGACGVWRGGSSASCCCGGWPTSGPTWSPRPSAGWGPSRGEAHAAHTRWQALQHSPRAPRGLACGRRCSGRPRSSRTAGSATSTSQVRRWPLPLWPHLYWEVLSGPGRLRAQRAPGAGARAPRCRRRPARTSASGSTSWTTSSGCPAPRAWTPAWRRRWEVHLPGGVRAAFVWGLLLQVSRTGALSRGRRQQRAEHGGRRPRSDAPARGCPVATRARTAAPKTTTFTSTLSAATCTGACGAAKTPHSTAGDQPARPRRAAPAPPSSPRPTSPRRPAPRGQPSSARKATVSHVQFQTCAMPRLLRSLLCSESSVLIPRPGVNPRTRPSPGRQGRPGLRERSAVRQRSADPREVAHRVDAGHLHDVTGSGRVDHLAVADVDAHVADRAVEEDQVAGLEVGAARPPDPCVTAARWSAAG